LASIFHARAPTAESRALTITPAGRRALMEVFALSI
jgi:hypothetical protein